MAVSANKIHLSGLARKLVLDGLLDEVAAAEHHQNALKNKQGFVPYLVEKKLVPSAAIADSASQEFGVPVIDINSIDIDMATVKLVKDD
ncbi:MAG: type IV-A pilus assembly ATPase PilB, partial [Gammaproteobacteria bacterium]